MKVKHEQIWKNAIHLPVQNPHVRSKKNKSGFFGDSWGGLCSEKLCFKNCLHAPQSTHLKTNAGPQNQDLERKNLSSDLNFLGLFPCFPREKIRSPTAGFAMSLWRRGVGHHQQHRGIYQLRSIQTAAGAMEGDHGISMTSWDQWEFQDPKMEVLYHIRPYFGGIFPYIGLT